MVIRQGDVFWIEIGEPSGAEPGYTHPHVVVQNNVFNQSKIATIMVCPLTSTLKRAMSPGNVMLEAREANLPKQSVVNVSQVFTVDKASLGDHIGSLSPQRIHQIVAGIKLLIEPRSVD